VNETAPDPFAGRATKLAVLVLAVCATAAASLFARLGLDAGSTGIQMAQWRLTVSALVLLPWGWGAKREKTRFSGREGVMLAAAGIFLSLHFAAWLTSLETIPVARSTLLVATTPLWAGLLGLAVPSLRPTRTYWIGLALSGIGIWAFSSSVAKHTDKLPSNAPSWIGDLSAVAGAVFVLFYFLLSQRLQRTHDTRRVVTWIYASAAIALWPMAALTHAPLFPTSAPFWIGVLGMAVCAQLFGHTALNWSLKHYSAAQVSAATLGEPVFAAALAWAVLGEGLSPVQIFGGGAVLAGVALALGSERSRVVEI
jgi:drug/metabolite transporter (DMT)-like permease